MLNYAQRRAIALLACIVVLLAWQSRLSSQRPILPPSEQQQQQTASHKAGAEKPDQQLDWNNWTRDPIAVFTALLTGFNGLLLASTTALWLATRKSAQISERTLTELERAFVNYVGLRYLSHKRDDGSVWWSLHFNWINSGASPAKKVRLYVGRYFEDVDIPADYPFDVPEDRPEIFMGAKVPMTTIRWSIDMDDLMAVREERKFLYFWGRADYRDIFKGTLDRVTKFSIRVKDFTGDPSKVWDDETNIVELRIDTVPSRHNDAT